LTKYAPRGTRNQGRPLKRLLDELDRNRPAMAYFRESKMMMMMMVVVVVVIMMIFPRKTISFLLRSWLYHLLIIDNKPTIGVIKLIIRPNLYR
jgi:hypothetical protein